jgi:hypothetical protein
VKEYPLIALTGYGRTGKDLFALPLLHAGYERICFGDIIKKQLDGLVQDHLGFSAFTEDNKQKQLIRGLLEQWGDSNYDGVMSAFFGAVDKHPKVVNTRLCRVREAAEWKKRGGLLVEVRRPGVSPATQWEADVVESLHKVGLVDLSIGNTGTPAQLHRLVTDMFCMGRDWEQYRAAGTTNHYVSCPVG